MWLVGSAMHLDVVRYLVDEQSVDPAGASSDNVTPFHVVCGMGHVEVVKFLIEEKGCNYTQMCRKKTKALPYLLFIQLVKTAIYILSGI